MLLVLALALALVLVPVPVLVLLLPPNTSRQRRWLAFIVSIARLNVTASSPVQTASRYYQFFGLLYPDSSQYLNKNLASRFRLVSSRLTPHHTHISLPFTVPSTYFLYIFITHQNNTQAKVSCKPSTPALPHKRRRPNQDLLERLARCEQLLKQYADGNVSTQRENAPTIADHSHGNNQLGLDPAPKAEPQVTSTFKPAGKVIEEDGNVRFLDNFIRLSFHDEVWPFHVRG